MREQEETLIARTELMDLQANGAKVDLTKLRKDKDDPNLYFVPFQEALSMYWAAADYHIEALKGAVD
jgi:hypothetical protein